MEVIIVVSKKQRGVIQDLHREVWSLSGELWQGDSIVVKWTLKKSLETSVCHIMGRLKFLFDRQFAIHPDLLQIQEKDKELLLKNLLQNVKIRKVRRPKSLQRIRWRLIPHDAQQCTRLSHKRTAVSSFMEVKEHVTEGNIGVWLYYATGSSLRWFWSFLWIHWR